MTVSTPVQIPPKMRNLPLDKHHRPVPWFAAWIDGVPDHRIVKPDAIRDALRFNKCWVCGNSRGRYGTFVIGPMCAVNRTSSEPPSHVECAQYSATACPFLTTPSMERRTNNRPDDALEPAGVMLTRNPGVTMTWTSRTWGTYEVENGLLVDIGEPTDVAWYCEGREATTEEILTSIRTGLPALTEMAEDEGPAAIKMLTHRVTMVLRMIPGSPSWDALQGVEA